MRRKDIMLSPDEDKEKLYDQINELHLQGKAVKVREHRSGFPAVTVDCEDIHIITDCISLEQWWARKKKREGEEKERS